MPARIEQACQRTGQSPPSDPIRQVQELAGRQADVVHLVGGGARNTLLCQLTRPGA
jgi:rhamnulokinase